MLLKMFNHDSAGAVIERVCKDILELNEAITNGWVSAPHLIGVKPAKPEKAVKTAPDKE